jgi:hypothetical protein
LALRVVLPTPPLVDIIDITFINNPHQSLFLIFSAPPCLIGS